MSADRSAETPRLGGRTRSAIVAHLRRHKGATPREVADAAGLSYDLVKRTMSRMRARGDLTSVGHGRYFLARGVHLVAVPDEDEGDSAEVSLSPQGDTTPAGDATLEESAAPGVPAERWRCPQCNWLQVVGGVAACEQCGWPRARGVAR